MINNLYRLLVVGSLLAFVSCASGKPASPAAADSSASQELHLGAHEFPITTKNTAAQAAFNRGINLTYAFSHGAAELEYRRAAELDPSAPMPWWGVALVNGPHINYPLVPAEKAKIAWDALSRARQLRANGSPLEQALIDALGARYVENQPEDRSKLDIAYAEAMRDLRDRYPTNADVVTLYAESLMDLHPWDFWSKDGNPKPWTPEIAGAIETALDLNPNHPGANHFYIHTTEASPAPGRALPAADRLRSLVPGAGHLVHMPAHIYVRVGQFEDAALSNEQAIRADAAFRETHPRPGFYAVYMLHNHHFLSFARMMQGQQGAALEAARALIAGVPEEFFEEFGPIADGYMAIASEVLMRFGKWEEILAEPKPRGELPIAMAMWRFTRAAALTALDRPEEAKKERAEFLKAVAVAAPDATFGNNKAHDILKIARNVLDGEMAARQNQFDQAINFLETAARIEDSLVYDEPPDWIQPVRHTLGITLLRAGKHEDAARVYREDLARFPGNGWSLYGLSRALELNGNTGAAMAVRRKFDEAWTSADTQIAASCLCQPGA